MAQVPERRRKRKKSSRFSKVSRVVEFTDAAISLIGLAVTLFTATRTKIASRGQQASEGAFASLGRGKDIQAP